jgi:hypothetical protein
MKVPDVRWLVLSGGLLCLSGVIHTGVFWISAGQWEGPLSWRKPILFGFSAGVTVLSLAWVLLHLRPQPWDTILANLLAGSLFIEVGLITLQTWRGVPSHFNHATPLDDAISNGMTALIVLATAIIALLTLRSFLTVQAPSTQGAAIRWGMGLLLASCVIGGVIQATGGETFGQAGVLKFPHGMSIHAIQVLPFLAWLLPRGAVAMVHLAGGGYGVLTVYALMQAFGGRARFEVTPFSAVLLLLGVIAVALPFSYALLHGRYRSSGQG